MRCWLPAWSALFLTACAAPQHSLDPAPRYVALGSSYAAGAGIGPRQPGSPEQCGRNTNNYASLLAARLNLSLVDQSCSGATTAHVLGPWGDLPAQIAAVNADTQLVTVTVGGNDVNYMGVVFGASCRAAEQPDCAPAFAPQDSDYASAEAGLRGIAREVHARAPGARLVFVQYVRLIGHTLCPAIPIAPADAATARAVGQRLADITARVASEEDAMLLPLDAASAGHGPCSERPWANGLPADYAPGDGAPWHPNAAGHAAAAALLEQLLVR